MCFRECAILRKSLKARRTQCAEESRVNRMERIFLIVGPPAVGKSTSSRALAAQFARSVHIPVDDLREMVVSGLVLPGADWSDALMQQVALARQNAAEMALNYHQAGFNVVIDDFWDAQHDSDYQRLLDHPCLHRVLLLPTQTQAHQRNLQRSGDSPGRAYIDEGIRIVYQQLQAVAADLAQQGWILVDSSNMPVDAVVAAVLAATDAPTAP